MANDSIMFEIVKDFGTISDDRWAKHLTLISWNGGEPKYDIRPWSDDMTKMGKGVTLTLEDLMALRDAIDAALSDSDEDEEEGIEIVEGLGDEEEDE